MKLGSQSLFPILGWVPVDIGPASFVEMKSMLSRCKVNKNTYEVRQKNCLLVFKYYFELNLRCSINS